jgi:hypothetical protein
MLGVLRFAPSLMEPALTSAPASPALLVPTPGAGWRAAPLRPDAAAISDQCLQIAAEGERKWWLGQARRRSQQCGTTKEERRCTTLLAAASINTGCRDDRECPTGRTCAAAGL